MKKRLTLERGAKMRVIRLDAKEFDVFWGNGWYNWARFSCDGKRLTFVKGSKVPVPVFSALKKKFIGGN